MPALRRAHLIANPKSGKGSGLEVPKLARQLAAIHGIELIQYEIQDPSQFDAQIERAADAAGNDGGTLIAAGGDGTIRRAAQAAVERGAIFGVVPCGTFNFFSRNHRIPDEAEGALEIALNGEVREVRLGRVNDHYFLINASLGLYAKSIRAREEDARRFGRDRLVVGLSTLRSLFRRHRRLRVELATAGKRASLETISIFIGNNALQLRDLSMDVARCMQSDLLAVVVLRPAGRLEMCRIIFRGIARTLEQEERLEMFCVESLQIKLPSPRVVVALDGELFTLHTPLRVETQPKVLRMRLPLREPP